MHIKAPIESLFTVLESLPVALYLTDAHGRVVLWNTPLALLTGVSDGRGQLPGPLLCMADNFVPMTCENPLLGRVLETREPLVRNDSLLSISTSTGERAVDFSGQPVIDEHSGELLGALAVLTERTSQRTLEKTMDGFERTAGHDLRNAVGVLEGYLPLLLSGEATRMEDGGQSIFQTLLRTSRLLNSIVNLMLLNARCCRSLTVREERPIQLSELLASSLRSIEPMAANKDIALVAEVDVQWVMRGSEELLHAAFANLFFAASKLARNRSQVQVTTGQENGHLEVRMSFTARPIEPLDLQRMFSALGEVQDPRLAVGVSVHLARVILQLHGATLRLLEPEVGTNVFAFALQGRKA